VNDDEKHDELVEADEVLTPDKVSNPRTVRRAAAAKALPDRFGRYSMYAGMASVLLLVLFPVLIFVLALAAAGIYFGIRTRRDLAHADEPERARKRGTIGIASGGFTILVLVALVIYFNVFYSVPEKLEDFNTEKPAAVG
jgi:hypothetical protein